MNFETAVDLSGQSDDDRHSAGEPGPRQAPERNSDALSEAVSVLIVEDEVFIQLDLETELTAAGYDVVGVANNASDAVSIAERERPDIVLMDVRLLGPRDGVDVALEIWQRFTIPSLFLSGNIDSSMQARAAPAQPLGFVSKPFRASQIIALLKQIKI